MTCTAWPVVWPCNPAAGTEEQVAAALGAAQDILWSRTGRRLGTCEVTESYRLAASGQCGRPYMTDDLVWHNGGRDGACCAIHLVNQPVQSITSVTVQGQLVPDTGYRLADGVLMRVGACWPTVGACDPPPVTVTYVWGVSISEPGDTWHHLAAAAMGEVANELVTAMCGGPCRLPSRAVSVTRAGVTTQLGAPAEWAKERLLGLPLADALILAVNPSRLMQRSRVYSPDMAQRG